nr:1161_t:CDS:2 [Entrophospora candida]CAG8536745.1 12225_t:CDS:2 [Entrophospora candida]
MRIEQCNHLVEPTRTYPLLFNYNINPQLDNNQIPYPQQFGISLQSPNHSCSDTYQKNSQSQSHQSHSHHRQQPQKDQPTAPIQRHQQRKTQKRTHALAACNSCRRLHLRCKKKEDSAFCNRCIETRREESCIFEIPKKRGRKYGSKNRPKKYETENRDTNAADDTVDDTKPCCHNNNSYMEWINLLKTRNV